MWSLTVWSSILRLLRARHRLWGDDTPRVDRVVAEGQVEAQGEDVAVLRVALQYRGGVAVLDVAGALHVGGDGDPRRRRLRVERQHVQRLQVRAADHHARPAAGVPVVE